MHYENDHSYFTLSTSGSKATFDPALACLDTALLALKAGISVVPPREDGTKAPQSEWREWQERLPSEDQVRKWYSKGLTGVGFVTGAVSGHLEMLEFEKEETWHEFKELANKFGLGDLVERIEAGYCEQTPGGGIHLLYRCKPVKPNTKLAQQTVKDPETGKEKRKTLIETRGEGGYVVVAPSCGRVHPSGRPYVLLKGGVGTIADITPEERDQLWQLARTFDEPQEKQIVYSAKPEKNVSTPDKSSPGDEFNRQVTWEELLPRYGWKLLYVRDGVGYWQRPGKDRPGCSATTNYAGSDLLYVFSTNAYPLEADRAYSKFAFYTFMEHGGDFKAAARELAKQGYGEYNPNESDHEQKADKERQAETLLRLGNRAYLFCTEDEEAYAAIELNGHREILPVRGRGFRRWLIREFIKSTGRIPNTDALNQVIHAFDALAGEKQHRLHLRIAEYEGAFWYDLADPGWRAIKITPTGWGVVDKPPIIFRRYQNTGAQVEPKQDGGNLWELFELVNLKSENDKILLLVYLVTLLVPEIPKPILVVYGEKGAGKSTLLRIIRTLVDPAVEPLLTLRSDERELAIQLDHNYAAFFDNISGVSQWQSDFLCRAATGAGFTTRALYTDEEERIFRLKRAVGITGINLVAGGTDLQDRFLSIELERIDKKERREEREILTEFERLRPYLFGAMLNALAEAMQIKPQMKFSELPRMADFAAWGAAVAEAIGIDSKDFMAAYWQNIGQINEGVLESHPLAAAIVALLQRKHEWKGAPGKLLEELENVATEERIDTKSKAWPKSSASLTRRLREIASNLAEAGIKIETGKDTGGIKGRYIHLFREEKEADYPPF